MERGRREGGMDGWMERGRREGGRDGWREARTHLANLVLEIVTVMRELPRLLLQLLVAVRGPLELHSHVTYEAAGATKPAALRLSRPPKHCIPRVSVRQARQTDGRIERWGSR